MEGFRYYDIMRWKEGKLFENDLLGIYIPGPGTYDLDQDGTDDVCFYVGTKPAGNVPLYLEIGEQIRLSNDESGYIICHSLITKNGMKTEIIYTLFLSANVLCPMVW